MLSVVMLSVVVLVSRFETLLSVVMLSVVMECRCSSVAFLNAMLGVVMLSVIILVSRF
jgi:hypothetical protein